jgi:hypothetical protein
MRKEIGMNEIAKRVMEIISAANKTRVETKRDFDSRDFWESWFAFIRGFSFRLTTRWASIVIHGQAGSALGGRGSSPASI